MIECDACIVGGGASGLVLADALLRETKLASIVVVERHAPGGGDDRTFSYWTRSNTPFDEVVRMRWERVRFAAPGLERTRATAPYRYETLRRRDLEQLVRGRMERSGRATWLSATASRTTDEPDAVTVDTDAGPVRARFVFDSRFRLHALQPRPGEHLVHQVFHGWEIETERDAFTPDTCTLFDFRTPQAGELRFFYVLPFSTRRALVEHVRMHPDRDEETFRAYLERVLEVGKYEILSREGGTTALTDARLPRRIGPRTLAIGRLGGMVKPTSGYAFVRMQRDAEHIARSLAHHGHPFELPAPRGPYALFDRVMLELLTTHPERAASVFTGMLKRNPPARLFPFLDEDARTSDVARLVSEVPIGWLTWSALRLAARSTLLRE